MHNNEYYFSQIFKQIKSDLGMKDVDIYAGIGVSAGTIHNWQNSKSLPNNEKVIKEISKFFSINLEYRGNSITIYIDKYISEIKNVLDEDKLKNILKQKDKGRYRDTIFYILMYLCEEDRKKRNEITLNNNDSEHEIDVEESSPVVYGEPDDNIRDIKEEFEVIPDLEIEEKAHSEKSIINELDKSHEPHSLRVINISTKSGSKRTLRTNPHKPNITKFPTTSIKIVDIWKRFDKIFLGGKSRNGFIAIGIILILILVPLFVHFYKSYEINYTNNKIALGQDFIEKDKYAEAIQIYTGLLKSSPKIYERIRNDLDDACSRLEGSENINMALGYLENIMKIMSAKGYFKSYADVQNNLGAVYSKQSELLNKQENLNKAITYFEDSLKVRTIEKYPKDYAQTQNNLGFAYLMISKITDMENNLNKAGNAFEEALKIRTVESFPLEHAITLSGRGEVYQIIGEKNNNKESLIKAITCYEEALNIKKLQLYHRDYNRTKENMEIAIKKLNQTY